MIGEYGPWTNVSNGTSTPDGEQLCQIILKFIHNYRTYGVDKSWRTDTQTHSHTSNGHCDKYVPLNRKWAWQKLRIVELTGSSPVATSEQLPLPCLKLSTSLSSTLYTRWQCFNLELQERNCLHWFCIARWDRVLLLIRIPQPKHYNQAR